ncbi:NHLP family bacteriocin export ABC transporter peptidase/permease/ATPase subunit [Paradesulfitobacterium aromaticivorans]
MRSNTQKITQKRVKTPTVLQMEAVECGAASLAIILGYYGRVVPLEELRIVCGVSRDGSKASNILKAARQYGFETKAYRKEPEALRAIRLPAIIHWNFNHFLVLEGFKQDKVYLNDPAFGPRVVTAEEFDNSFTGVVLIFTPTADFVPEKGKRNLLKTLRPRLRGSKSALVYVVLAGLLLVVPGLLIPVFGKVFIDHILLGRMENWLMPLLMGMMATALLRGGLTWLQEYYLLRLETKIALRTSGEFFWHILRLPIEFFNQRQAGEIGFRVMLNDRVAQLLTRDLADAALNLVMIVFYLFLMIQYNLRLTVIGVAAALLNMAFLRLTDRRRTDQTLRLSMESGKLVGTSMGGLQIIETLKATGAESDFFSKWAGNQAKLMNAEQEIGVTNLFLTAVPNLLTALNNVVILTVGGYEVIGGNMTIGMLVAFQSLMTSFMAPVNQMVQLGGTLKKVEGDMNKLDDVFKYPLAQHIMQSEGSDEAAAISEAPEMPEISVKLSGRVELRNLTFGYSPLEPPLIENFNLSIDPGSRVAIVGASGSGKSTVAKVLTGLYEPWAGEVLLDGRPRTQIPRSVLTNSLAVVDQDIQMFEGSIKDNLTLWDSTVLESDLIHAAKDSCIHEIIAARPGGYDAPMAEGGRNYSGGQLQRMEIARALVNNPTILILDEATSALDPKTEQQVDASFRRRGCTCVIVAHRLSTIRDCDEIIVLDRGKVVQRGTHDQLIEQPGHYQDLIQAQ